MSGRPQSAAEIAAQDIKPEMIMAINAVKGGTIAQIAGAILQFQVRIAVAATNVGVFSQLIEDVRRQTGINFIDALVRFRVLETIPPAGITLQDLLFTHSNQGVDHAKIRQVLISLGSEGFVVQEKGGLLRRTRLGEQQLQ